MLSEKQIEERKDKVKTIFAAIYKLLKINNRFPTIDEISLVSNIPSSTIQRYLNNDELLSECEVSLILISKIKEELKNNKKIGNIKGGINYRENNTCLKDSNGKFIGSRKK